MSAAAVHLLLGAWAHDLNIFSNAKVTMFPSKQINA